MHLIILEEKMFIPIKLQSLKMSVLHNYIHFNKTRGCNKFHMQLSRPI